MSIEVHYLAWVEPAAENTEAHPQLRVLTKQDKKKIIYNLPPNLYTLIRTNSLDAIHPCINQYFLSGLPHLAFSSLFYHLGFQPLSGGSDTLIFHLPQLALIHIYIPSTTSRTAPMAATVSYWNVDNSIWTSIGDPTRQGMYHIQNYLEARVRLIQDLWDHIQIIQRCWREDDVDDIWQNLIAAPVQRGWGSEDVENLWQRFNRVHQFWRDGGAADDTATKENQYPPGHGTQSSSQGPGATSSSSSTTPTHTEQPESLASAQRPEATLSSSPTAPAHTEQHESPASAQAPPSWAAWGELGDWAHGSQKERIINHGAEVFMQEMDDTHDPSRANSNLGHEASGEQPSPVPAFAQLLARQNGIIIQQEKRTASSRPFSSRSFSSRPFSSRPFSSRPFSSRPFSSRPFSSTPFGL